MDVGILFDDFDELAWGLQSSVAEQGFETELNAPYSGRDGMIYAARRHGLAHGLVYVELEVRQDLLATPSEAAAVADRLAVALSSFAP
jgi:predicted N-formylglutamate amidohydrolase